MRIEIQKENTELLNSIIDFQLFDRIPILDLEFVFRPDCNQNCEYCYLKKYGNKMYPVEERLTNKELLNNFLTIFEFLILDKKVSPNSIELYAGDLFYDNFFFELMPIIYNTYKIRSKNDIKILQAKTRIIVPSNLSFCEFPEKKEQVIFWIEKLKEFNIDLKFSYSSDGLYAISSREKKELTQKWFDNTLEFCGKYDFGAHPMISPYNIDKAIENYNWWLKMFEQYYPKDHWSPMFLEVRDDNWDENSIIKYLELLNHMVQVRLNKCNNDILELTKHLFSSTIKEEYKEKIIYSLEPIHYNDLISLTFKAGHGSQASCGLHQNVVINCQNLSLIPCHRLGYKQFEGGYFSKEDNKFIASNGFNAYLNLVETNTFVKPKCAHCEIRDFCHTGCVGAQYEQSMEPQLPLKSVCKLNEARVAVLMEIYYKLGVFKCLFSENIFD